MGQNLCDDIKQAKLHQNSYIAQSLTFIYEKTNIFSPHLTLKHFFGSCFNKWREKNVWHV